MNRFQNVLVVVGIILLSFQPVMSQDAVDVQITPSSLEAGRGGEFEIKIEVTPGELGISGGEINLEFEPSALEAVSLDSGDLLGNNPLVGIEEIDNEAGAITYAAARKGQTSVPSPPGALATINFRVMEAAEIGTYNLGLTNVGLANENFQDIVDIKAQGATIEVGKGFPIQYAIIGIILIAIVAAVLIPRFRKHQPEKK